MMKWRAIIYLSFIFVFLTGCATKRTTQTEEHRRGRTELRLHDSLIVRQLRHESRLQNSRLRHIRLSPPDSLGRQAVRSITEVEVQETSRTSDTVVHQQVSQRQQSRMIETSRQSETVKSSTRAYRWPFSLLWMAVLGGFALWLFRRRG